MLLYGCEYADLVEAFRTAGAHETVPLRITRICLDAPPARHLLNFRETVLPRLYAATAFVQQLRRDDGARYAWLLGSAADRWSMLLEGVPHFADAPCYRPYGNAPALPLSVVSPPFRVASDVRTCEDEARRHRDAGTLVDLT
jgi:hypothetical protein